MFRLTPSEQNLRSRLPTYVPPKNCAGGGAWREELELEDSFVEEESLGDGEDSGGCSEGDSGFDLTMPMPGSPTWESWEVDADGGGKFGSVGRRSDSTYGTVRAPKRIGTPPFPSAPPPLLNSSLTTITTPGENSPPPLPPAPSTPPTPATPPIQLHIHIPFKTDNSITHLRTELNPRTTTFASLQDIISASLTHFDLAPNNAFKKVIVLRTVCSAVNTSPGDCGGDGEGGMGWQAIACEAGIRNFLAGVVGKMQPKGGKEGGSGGEGGKEEGWLCPCGCGGRAQAVRGSWVAQLEVKLTCG